MSSVQPVQPIEARRSSAGNSPSPGGDLFSEALDRAAPRERSGGRPDASSRQAPAAPASRQSMRAEALGNSQTPSAQAGGPPATADAPQVVPTATDTSVTAAAPSNLPPAPEHPVVPGEVAGEGEEKPELASTAADASVGEPANVATGEEQPTVDAAPANEGDVVADDPEQPAFTQPVTTNDKPPAQAPVPAAPQAQADAVPQDDTLLDPDAPAQPALAADEPVVPMADAARSAAQTSTPAQTATGSAAPPVMPDAPRAQTPLPEAPQTQAPPANAAAMADEAFAEFEGDPDAQLPQRPAEQLAPQTKPQETKPSMQAELAKALAQPADAEAPKTQAPLLPEPVRALAATLNSASLHAANAQERNPVPLSGPALAVEIVSRLRDGMRRFDIRLDPPELGRLDVRLEIDRTGNVKTRMTVDRPETLELMQREARGLERALQQAGLKTDSGGLEFSLRSHADHDHANGRQFREERSGGEAHDDTAPVETVIAHYRSAAFARGGVDIRI